MPPIGGNRISSAGRYNHFDTLPSYILCVLLCRFLRMPALGGPLCSDGVLRGVRRCAPRRNHFARCACATFVLLDEIRWACFICFGVRTIFSPVPKGVRRCARDEPTISARQSRQAILLYQQVTIMSNRFIKLCRRRCLPRVFAFRKTSQCASFPFDAVPRGVSAQENAPTPSVRVKTR